MTWLLVDVPNLAASHFFARPAMMRGNLQTGDRIEVVHAVVVALDHLQERFNTRKVVLAFDEGPCRRKEILPYYKDKRETARLSYTNSTKDYKYLRRQLTALRLEVLPKLGYTNVLYAKGYEADDVIASVVKSHSWAAARDEAVIVSNDKDFYQLLDDGVRIYNHSAKKCYDAQDMFEEWGFDPSLWVSFKSMVGCASDDVPGIKGIGNKLAARFLQGVLSPTSPAYLKIALGLNTAKRNRKVIKIPYEGTPEFTLHKQSRLTLENYTDVFVKELGVPVPRTILNNLREKV